MSGQSGRDDFHFSPTGVIFAQNSIRMRKLFRHLLLPAALVSAACSNEFTDAVDALCKETFPSDGPGAAVLIMKGDKVVYENGFGLADMQTKDPITPDTFFNLASVSKQFTASALLQLQEAGKIRIDDKVKDYFPQFTAPVWDDITIGNFLSHSSGLPVDQYRRTLFTHQERVEMTDSAAVIAFDTIDTLSFAPGTGYQYENATYTLMGKLIENVSGEAFADYMRRHVFDKAGMARTMYFEPGKENLIPMMSHGYELEEGRWQECDWGEETCFGTRPDGGLYSSVREFAQWERALRECSVISEESRELAQSPKIPAKAGESYVPGSRMSYCYGWLTGASSKGERVIYHFGGNGGFRTAALRYPESGTFIVVLSNQPEWDRPAFLCALENIVL